MNKKAPIINILVFLVIGIILINFNLVFNLFSASISTYLIPNINSIYEELSININPWSKAILWTFGMSTLSLFLSLIIGVSVGYISSYFRLAAIDLWAKLLWSIPLIAISTYLALIVGLNWAYGVTLSVFLSFYPIEKHVFNYCSTRSDGINSIAASFALTKWQEYLYLRLNGSIRSMGTSLAQSIPLCFVGETMAEFSTGKMSDYSIGLGGMLRKASSYSNYTQLWLSIILMMLLVFMSSLSIQLIWNIKFPQNNEGDALQ